MKHTEEDLTEMAQDHPGEVLFRFHRGGYDDSMKTVVGVKSLDELRRVIDGDCHSYVSTHTIRFLHMGYDDRNGWDTWNVLASNACGYMVVIGQSNGVLEEACD